ncbi:MAG TPA: ABC transporter ATP-binding protein [Planctomycetota bacterium]|nr:ABC transporter ATP-binding protein [Planctomycetota bacterium]
MQTLQKLRALRPYLRPYRRAYLEGIILIVLSVPVLALNPLILKEAVDILKSGVGTEAIPYLAALFVALMLWRGFLMFRGRFRVIASSRRVERDLRNEVFEHLSRLPVGFFDRHRTGDITSRVINDVEGVRQMAGFAPIIVANVGILFVLALVAMFALDATLALFALIPLALVSGVVALTEKPLHDQSLKIQDKLGEVSNLAQDAFMGIRVIKGFAREEPEVERFREECGAYRRMNVRFSVLRGGTEAGTAFLATSCVFVTLLVGGAAVHEGRITLGTFMAFTAYQLMLIFPAMAIGWLLLIVQRGAACLDRLQEYLDVKPEPGEGDGDVPIEGGIEIRGLTFRYREDSPASLENVSLKIPRGSRVAIVGRVGSGKTTLMNVLLRLYPVPDGTVYLDGRDINTIPVQAVRKAVACVPQDNFLFSDTIRENVRFGSLNGLSSEEMVRACLVGQIHSDIEGFPERYEQVIGERGITLSGGQKQRLSIARAFVRNPRVIILDDAFSSVDAETEREVLKRLREEAEGRTIILITHRLSSVREMDVIAVLDEGRLVEAGPHDLLMAKKGTYAALYDRFVATRELMEL